jgi:4-aminobutyrate aminotransferase-like enzyme
MFPIPPRCTASARQTAWRPIHRLFKADIDPARVAAIVSEPVQGEGGFYVAPPFLFPLTIQDDVFDEALGMLEAAILG